MKKKSNNWLLAIFFAVIGAIILFIFAESFGISVVACIVFFITMIEYYITGQNDRSWYTKIHILGCLIFIMLIYAAWWAQAPYYILEQRPFHEFQFETKLGDVKVVASYWWWVLIAIPTIRCIRAHRKK